MTQPNFAELEEFMLKGSNLPGPRGNLELASAFADYLAGGNFWSVKHFSKDLCGLRTVLAVLPAPGLKVFARFWERF